MSKNYQETICIYAGATIYYVDISGWTKKDASYVRLERDHEKMHERLRRLARKKETSIKFWLDNMTAF